MSGRWRAKLSQEELAALDALIGLLGRAQPREIKEDDEVRPIVIFTDGASEGDSHTWGAVLLDPATGQKLVAGGVVPPAFISAWFAEVGDSIINQIELYPVTL
eukprot:2871137-Amphidinium_carterae.1